MTLPRPGTPRWAGPTSPTRSWARGRSTWSTPMAWPSTSTCSGSTRR